MPAPRLPWIKFWPELVDHAKFVELTDRERWTWVEVWAKASQQPRRWHFASIGHAVKVTGRREADIRKLIEARLIDEDTDGIHIHNAPKWQERSPSDERGYAPPSPLESSAKPPRSLREISVEKKKEKERIEGEKDVIPPAAPQRPPRGQRRVTVADEKFQEELIEKFTETFGSREAVLDVINTAMGHKARGKCSDEQAYLRGWLRRDAMRLPGHARTAPVVVDADCECMQIRADLSVNRNAGRRCPVHGWVAA